MSLNAYHFKETVGLTNGDLIFTFHGTGGSETQFHQLAQDLQGEAHVISMRGDVSEHGASRFFKRAAEGVYDMQDLEKRTAKMANFLKAYVERLKPSRVLGLGYSNGANILASVMFLHGALFQNVALLHPLIPWTPAKNPTLKNTKVLITAGRRDPICPPQFSTSLEAYCHAQGADTTTEWYDGGHEIARSELTALNTNPRNH